MNELEALEAIRDCQSSANLTRKPYSICMYYSGLIVMLKTKAVELGYEILETCRPVNN